MGEIKQFPNNADTLTKGPDGGDNGGMEARVARLESGVSHIRQDISDMKTDFKEFRKDQRTDFRLSVGITIAATLGLAGLMATGFGWL